jgi:ABC-2 type transport system ATP-binding protein
MKQVVEVRDVTKRYGRTVALDGVTLAIPRRSIVGLVGRNGSGKTTLLRHITGLVLPDSGECVTLGRPAAQLDRAELSRIGAVHQHDRLLEWMRAGQLLEYVGSFYDRWDRELERSLLETLDVDTQARVGAMSPGTLQKLALVVATCHHPELLLLDEPLSDLDPIARQSVLAMLLDRFSSDDMTIVISSHMLRDIEPVVDRIICLDRGRVVADDGLDELKERYAEWIVTSPNGRLPATYDEPYVVSSRGDRVRAHLLVRDAGTEAAAFAAGHNATVEARPLNLDGIFRLLVGATGAPGAPAAASRTTGTASQATGAAPSASGAEPPGTGAGQ